MRSLNNVDQLFILKDVARATVSGVIDSYGDLTDGEGVWLTQGGTVADNGTSGEDVAGNKILRFCLRSGTNLLVSDDIDVTTITSYDVTKYSAAVQQVDYFGYNGTSGEIDVINDNVYQLRIYFHGETGMDFAHQRVKYGTYESDSAAIQSEIALGLTANLEYNFKNEKPDSLVSVKAICSAAGTALSNDAGDLIVGKKGSFYLAIGEESGDNDMAVLAAGDFVRLGTTTSSNVYQIVSGATTAADGGTVKLDRPLSADVSLTGATTHYITAAQGLAADWGVLITGVAKKFTAGKNEPSVLRFSTSIKDCGTTVFGNLTAPSDGTGTTNQVYALEWELQGLEGAEFRTMPYGPGRTSRVDTVAAETYDIATITYNHKMVTPLGDTVLSPKRITFACATCADPKVKQHAAANTGVFIVFEDWAVTSNYAIPGLSTKLSSTYFTNY